MSKFDMLFKPMRSDDWMQGGIEQVGIMTGRDCPSGCMAFGYPFTTSKCYPQGIEHEHRGYDFYSSWMAIELEDIPDLIGELERRGYWLSRISDCTSKLNSNVHIHCDENGDEHSYAATRSLLFASQVSLTRECGVFTKRGNAKIA